MPLFDFSAHAPAVPRPTQAARREAVVDLNPLSAVEDSIQAVRQCLSRLAVGLAAA